MNNDTQSKESRLSMRARFAAIFALVLAAILVIIVLLNTWGLQAYYQSRKVNDIETVYNRLNAAIINGSRPDMESILNECSEKYNISVAVVDAGTNSAVISSERDGEVLLQQLRDRLFGTENENEELIVKENERYKITKTEHGLTCFGYTSDNNTMILMSTPLENIRENADISNRFLLYIALIAMIVGGIAVFLVSGKAVKMSELEAANEKLKSDLAEKEKQNAIKQEFIANVSHELKTPIAVIQGYAEGLQDGLCEDDESRAYYSGVIVDESKKMNRIVRQLILLNSLESGAEQTEMSPFDLSELVKGVSENERLLAEKKNVQLVTEVPDGIEAIGDEFKIESVVTNYLSNAVNHVSDSGRIEVKLEKRGDTVRCSVFNTGSRIPEDALEHIWDKFYKIDKAHTRAYGGSGIGLSIVKAVMEAHEQPYGVNNRDDGVEFWFDLKTA